MAGVDLFDFPAFKPECRGGMRECADKLMSEAAEAFAEIRNLEQVCSEWPDFRHSYEKFAVALELADVMQVCRNVCEVCGVDRNLMYTAFKACVNRNSLRDGGRYE